MSSRLGGVVGLLSSVTAALAVGVGSGGTGGVLVGSSGVDDSSGFSVGVGAAAFGWHPTSKLAAANFIRALRENLPFSHALSIAFCVLLISNLSP